MKYHQLEVGSHKAARRVGRSIAAGQGKTAGRGTKGQKARTGSSRKPGFEGGQTPLMQHLPKLHGFRSHKPEVELVFTNQLNHLGAKSIDTSSLADRKLITSPYAPMKLLHKGDINKKLVVKLPAASASAVLAIEQAGGSFEKVSRLARPSTKKEL